jgi:hypothetical protein
VTIAIAATFAVGIGLGRVRRRWPARHERRSEALLDEEVIDEEFREPW